MVTLIMLKDFPLSKEINLFNTVSVKKDILRRDIFTELEKAF